VAFTIRVNGKEATIDADGATPLLWVLRDLLGMTGTKYGCGLAQCGACTVHVNGAPTRACSLPLQSAVGTEITTIEGIGSSALGQRVQQAWLAHDVPQCGYCQGGQILAATALLASNPNPSEAQIDTAMAGNICRCGTYVRIRAAIKSVAAQMRGRA
jgi:isoquinoline 1-oxidoreductase subunit alpha